LRLFHAAWQADRATQLHAACELGIVESLRALIMHGGAAINEAMVSQRSPMPAS
jgi:hypothetical protein